MILGALPVVGWTLFSLFYYGFPFPNTAYAKLGTGIARHEVIVQGLRYLADSLIHDPITLALMTLALFVALKKRESHFSSKIPRLVGIGIVLQLIYVVFVGGDFMSGRFLTAPLVAALFIMGDLGSRSNNLGPAKIAVLFLGIPGIQSTLLSGSSYSDMHIRKSGIANERGYYFQQSSLFRHEKGIFSIRRWELSPMSIREACGGLGFQGMLAGPGVHFVDTCALADPLLAHLPSIPDSNWRIGHFYRSVPDGYEQSLLRDSNLLTDPHLSSYYESIRLIVRGDLFDPKRLREIMKINMGFIPTPDFKSYLQGRNSGVETSPKL
ncbi:MAG: hypothetical protein ABIR96_09810 [Bdellovibrionota bacterium]